MHGRPHQGCGLAVLSSGGAEPASVSPMRTARELRPEKGQCPWEVPAAGLRSAPPPGRDPLIRFSQYSVRSAWRSKHWNKAAPGGPRLLTPGSRPLFTLNGAARRLARG